MKTEVVHLATTLCRSSKHAKNPVTTHRLSDVTCKNCLNRVKRQKLADPSNLPKIPTILAYETNRFRGRRTISGRCPTCGKTLHHSGGFFPAQADGHRAAHCTCWPDGYIIRDAEKCTGSDIKRAEESLLAEWRRLLRYDAEQRIRRQRESPNRIRIPDSTVLTRA